MIFSILEIGEVSYAGASKKQNARTTAKQKRIDTLYQRYTDGLINSSKLLTGLSYLVGK